MRISAALALLLCALAASAQVPDLILLNGKVITVDDRFSIAQAIAIKGDRFLATGSSQQIASLAGPDTRRIDLHGRTVIPGLIDDHIHLLRAASTWLRELRFDGVYSRTQALDMLRARVKTAQPGEWIYNLGGWMHQQFNDNPAPFTAEELDRIAPENPVALQESYYQVFLNHRALHALGIEANKPDPPEFLKGSIQRDAAGMPTGIVKSDIAATRVVANHLPRVPAGELESSAAALVKDMNRVGLTSFGVPGCDAPTLSIFQKWHAAGSLNARIFCIDGTAAARPDQVAATIEQLAPLRAKLFQGDSYIDHIAFGESIYTPLHDPMFTIKSDPQPDQLEQWRRIAREIAKAGLPMHVHAELHDTINAFLDQIEAINREFPIHNLRWVFAHLNQIDASQLERMKKLGMYAAIHPWAVINGALMPDMPPFKTIQASGITWGLGSDGTAANDYAPFNTLQFAVTGQMAGGAKVNSQTISREDALLAHTRKNAYFLFQENNLGSIQPGMLADLVVLDRDYLIIPATQIHDIKPVMTIVGGRIAYESR
jgi:predicted amidohydrolase YtcJ